jgi:DNA-binding LacI/PurR family transcriptional regulator
MMPPGASNLARSSTRPKIGDVASAAGVSLGTVSAVLNHTGRISQATRERVRDAISALGYQPDLYASNLARRSSKLIGVIVSNLQNPFFAETAQAIEDEASKHGYQISLSATNFFPEQHRKAVRQLLGARIAGLAVITSENDEEARTLAMGSGIPCVFLDSGKPSALSSVIRIDSRGGMRAAVEHLIHLGHRDLLFVRNSQNTTGPPLLSHRLRDQGFTAAIKSFGVRGVRAHTVDVHGSGADAGEQAIAEVFGKHRFTAAIAVTDLVAMGVYRGLHSRGVRIPEDVSVVGFDNTYFSRFMNPPLTTVDLPRADLARLVCSALLQPHTQSIFHLPTHLVVRESTAPPAAAQRHIRPTRVQARNG